MELEPSLPNLRHGETYTEWAKRRLQESFVENVSLFDAVIAPLIGYAIALELEMQNRSADRAKELNRRVDVENALLEFAAGKREHFTPEEAKAMAHKLGVPPPLTVEKICEVRDKVAEQSTNQEMVDVVYPPKNLEEAVCNAINCFSAENGSDTPDFILAEYLMGCLDAFDKLMKRREQWYGRGEPKEQLKLPLVECTHKTWYKYTSTFSAPTRCPDCGKQMRGIL